MDEERTTADYEEASKRTVALPDPLVSRGVNRLPRTEFDSPDEYIAFVLEEVLYRVSDRTDEEHETIDQEEVHRRLESLGYPDE